MFPPALRALVDAELAAGNMIVEVASGFPAPPAGAYVKLSKPVSTRPRQKSDQLNFYDRKSSLYSGEWTDAKRFYFLLEPPHPPEPEPDMNAIREAMNLPTAIPAPSASVPEVMPQGKSPLGKSVVDRFTDSMNLSYEKWHDRIGYDLALLQGASWAERTEIEERLLRSGCKNWRDVEALAALHSEKANGALRQAFVRGDAEIRHAVVQHAPELVSEAEHQAHLIEGLRTGFFYHGLTQVLESVATFHPPEIIHELLNGVMEREGSIACHFAAMLMYIHGQAASTFDWNHRPFFLRFNTEDRLEREESFRELCARIGVSAEPFLG